MTPSVLVLRLRPIFTWLFESFRFPFWVLIHPSAWGAYIARIDPTLPSDFSLQQLTPAQRRLPAIRRLVIQTLVFLPVVYCIAWPILMIVIGRSPRAALGIAITSLFYGLVGGFFMAYTVNLPAAFIFGSALNFFLAVIPVRGGLFFIPISLSAGLTASVLIINLPSPSTRKRKREFQGLLLGIVASAVVVAISYLTISGILGGYLVPLPRGVHSPTVIFLRVSLPWALAITLFTLAVFSFHQHLNFKLGILLAIEAIFLAAAHYGTLVTRAPLRLILTGLGGGLMVSVFFSLGWNLSRRFGGPLAAAVAGAVLAGPGWMPFAPFIISGFRLDLMRAITATGLMLLMLTQSFWRPVILYPVGLIWNRILYLLDRRRLARGESTVIYQHSAFWDEMQVLPWLTLEDHLLFLAGFRPVEAWRAIDQLMKGRQRWAARFVQIEIFARQLEQCRTVQAIGQVHHQVQPVYPDGNPWALLSGFSQTSRDLETALHQASPYHRRISLGMVSGRLESLERELVLEPHSYSQRFIPIVEAWQEVIRAYMDSQAEVALQDHELENPFIYGLPLTEKAPTFTGRKEIQTEIEHLAFNRSRMALLVTGQRCMGKTSLLLNLAHRLPARVVPLFVDGQAASGLHRPEDFLSLFVMQLRRSSRIQRGIDLPELDPVLVSRDPFLSLNHWFEQANENFIARHQVALLMIDEFDEIGKTVIETSISSTGWMSLLRHIIQHLDGWRVLLAGNDLFERLESWSGYLVNVRLLKIGYLSRQETERLITRPIQGFHLNFAPEAVEAVVTLTHGHPHLVQLLGYELVRLKNEQPLDCRLLATQADIDEVVPRALLAGSLFFKDVLEREVTVEDRLLLKTLASTPRSIDFLLRQFGEGVNARLEAFQRRDLIECVNCRYGFQVELMRRWVIDHSD